MKETSKYRDVSKEEFDQFVLAYPNPLERDVTGICEHPVLTYNDFSLGPWSYSVVARVVLNESYPKNGTEPHRWSPNTYALLSETT